MLRILGITDKGLVRYANEDRFTGEVFSPDFAYGAVCDGLGGENAGGVASGIACEEIRRMMENSYRENLDERSVYMVLESAISTANTMVYDKACQAPDTMGGMGTTVCMAVVTGGKAIIANIGDSRAYLLRQGQLSRLTVDHTRAQMLLDMGRITQGEMDSHPQRHSLTRAVGVEKSVDAGYSGTELMPGDSLLLCSDGLYNMLDPLTLRECLKQAVAQDDGSCLIDAANSRGGEDNITAVILTREENGNG